MSYNYFFDLISVFFLSFVGLFIFRKIAKKIGLVDSPSSRKKHKGDVPLVGGLAICLVLVVFLSFDRGLIPSSYLYLVSILILTAVGAADDMWDISYKFRLVVQAALALSMVAFAGLKMKTIGNVFAFGSIDLGWMSPIVTMIAVIGAINAFNMVDGIDGLLGGLSVVTFSSLAFIFVLNDAPNLSYFCIIIAVSILPYIMMNLGLLGRRRRVFMGDAGSMLIGLTVIWVLLVSTQEASTRVIRPVTALWLIAIPLMDMVAIMFRRVRRGDSPFKPDREHLHHIFQRLGFSSTQTLASICFIAFLYAAFGIWGEINRVPESLMFGLFISSFLLYAYCLSHVWVLTSRIKRYFKRG